MSVGVGVEMGTNSFVLDLLLICLLRLPSNVRECQAKMENATFRA